MKAVKLFGGAVDTAGSTAVSAAGGTGKLSDLVKDGMQILVEGDSIFSDLSTDPSRAYPHPPRWGSFLQSSPIFSRRNLVYFNNASPGARLHLNNVRFDFNAHIGQAERADSGRRRCLEHGTGTVVICNVGVNDATAGAMTGTVISGEPDYVDVSGWVAAYEALAQRYKDLSTPTRPIYFVACTTIAYEGAAAQSAMDQANDLIRRSTVFDAVVDLATVLTDSSDPDFYIPDTLGGAPTPTDGTHPSERGAYYQFRAIADALFGLPPLSQDGQLTDFDGLYSPTGGSGFAGNVGTLQTFADNQAAIVAGLTAGDLYLRTNQDRGTPFIVFAEANFGTQFVWTATSAPTRILAFPAATDTVDVQIPDSNLDSDPSHFIDLRMSEPVGTIRYIRNSIGNLFSHGGGTGDNGRIGIRPGGNIGSISGANGADGFTDATATNYIWAPTSEDSYLKLEVTSLDGSGNSIYTPTPITP